MEDDQIAIKMLTRFNQIKRNTSKAIVDVEMMLRLLEVVRRYDVQDSWPCLEPKPSEYFGAKSN